MLIILTNEAMMAKLLTNLLLYLGNFLPTWELSLEKKLYSTKLDQASSSRRQKSSQREIKEAGNSTSAFIAQHFPT